MTGRASEYDLSSGSARLPVSRVALPLVLVLTLAACETQEAELSYAPDSPAVVLGDWIGQPVVREDGTHFVEEPSLQPDLEQALSVEYGVLDKLSNLDSVAAYTATPVDFVGNAFVVEFTPDVELAGDDRRIWLVVNGENGDVFTLLRDEGFPFFRPAIGADLDALAPETIDWVSERSGMPFDEMGRAPASFR